jgi:hypothetical protein
MDNIEAMVIAAARQEGLRPSPENLPASGELVPRHRVDDMGSRVTEWHGRSSFIADMSRPGRRVARIIDPRSRSVIWGRPLDRV